MSSLINKVKDKLNIGSKDDKIGSATYNRHTTEKAEAPGAKSGAGSIAPGTASTAPSTATNGRQTSAQGAAMEEGAAQRGSSVGQGAAAGSQAPAGDVVTVNERDPNWLKARELTDAAEKASKISAAKAYEAEAHLVAAQESHATAQDATNRQAELAAQAEAERQNIGGADYVHRELDQAKHKAEEHEKIHIDMNKDLEQARNLVAAKEGELGSIAPVVAGHQQEIDGISNKLGSVQGARAELEQAHGAHATRLSQLRDQHGQYTSEIARLEEEVEQLNLRAQELEDQARAARAEATDKANQLRAAQEAAGSVVTEANKTAAGLQNVQRDLQGYQGQEAELSQRLSASQAAAKEAADLAAAKEAELQLARQQHEAERQKGQPVAQDIERYHKQIQEKEREYVEAQESSKAAKAAYEKFAAEASKAAEAANAAAASKNAQLETYEQLKKQAQTANAKQAIMWDEAKKFGNTGDTNALQRLVEAEKNLSEGHGTINQPIVAPDVGPKQPTTAGPKIHRSERAKETNEEESRENIQTQH